MVIIVTKNVEILICTKFVNYRMIACMVMICIASMIIWILLITFVLSFMVDINWLTDIIIVILSLAKVKTMVDTHTFLNMWGLGSQFSG